MYKKLISPLQMWLMAQGRCVGCGSTLTHGNKKIVDGQTVVKCPKCTRLYIVDKTGNYRRALLEEV